MGEEAHLSTMSVDAFLGLPHEVIVQQLPTFLASYVTSEGDAQQSVVEGVAALRDTVKMEEWSALVVHMHQLGSEYGFYRRNALAARIANAYMCPLLHPESALGGLEHLDLAMEHLAGGRRVMMVGNHLSYADTMALRQLLVRSDRLDAMARITAVAGPKVYSEPMRRLGAAGIHSIKVAQSSRLDTNEVALSPRDVVRITKEAMAAAEVAMDEGCMVLIYPEGTRSRSGRLESFLRATNRWLSLPNVVILPLVVWGSENLYLLESDRMKPARCDAAFGPPIVTEEIAGEGPQRRDAILTAAYEAVAALLPQEYRPEPGTAVWI